MSKRTIGRATRAEVAAYANAHPGELLELGEMLPEERAEHVYRKLHPICGLFLRCTNPATTTRPNPIVGDVPCCERCAERFDRAERPNV